MSLLVILLASLGFIFLVIDLKQEYNTEIQAKQQEKYQCLSKYKENEYKTDYIGVKILLKFWKKVVKNGGNALREIQ